MLYHLLVGCPDLNNNAIKTSVVVGGDVLLQMVLASRSYLDTRISKIDACPTLYLLWITDMVNLCLREPTTVEGKVTVYHKCQQVSICGIHTCRAYLRAHLSLLWHRSIVAVFLLSSTDPFSEGTILYFEFDLYLEINIILAITLLIIIAAPEYVCTIHWKLFLIFSATKLPK